MKTIGLKGTDNKILVVTGIDQALKTIYFQRDSTNANYESLHCDFLSEILDVIADSNLTIKQNLYEAGYQALTNEKVFENYTPIYNGWLENDWAFRVKISYQASAKFAYNYPQWIETLKTEPANPIHDEPTVKVIYMNNIPDDVRALLTSYGATIETKPLN